MAVSKILVMGLIVGSLFLTGVIGLMTPAGHDAADGWFGHDHHEEDDCGDHHHFYQLWDIDHHQGHHHGEDNDHEDCYEEYDNRTV